MSDPNGNAPVQPVYPPITPNFAVRDPRASIAWFEMLGFTSLGEATTPDGAIVHAELARGAARIMLGPAMGAAGAPGLELYFRLDSGIDDLYADVQANALTVAEELKEQFWGDRTFIVVHPDGYRLMFAQAARDVSMEEIQSALEQMAPATA